MQVVIFDFLQWFLCHMIAIVKYNIRSEGRSPQICTVRHGVQFKNHFCPAKL
jgi:hypothetical protein